MKKSLALLAVAMLLVSASGCGCCRGLFGRSSVGTAGPFYGRLAPRATGACCNTCGPVCSDCNSCSNNMCTDCNTCASGDSCGCESGSPVTYGFDGGVVGMPLADGTVIDGGMVNGGFVDGGFVDGGFVDGGVISGSGTQSAPISVPAGSGGR